MKSGSEQALALLPTASLQRLIDLLQARGYRVVAPTVRDGAVLWDTIRQVSDLPIGWRDVQEPGHYRLENTGSGQMFGVVHGPQSLKPFSFPPRELLLQIERTTNGFSARPTLPLQEKVAIVGARACDLAGLAIQDQIFLKDAYRDPYYEARREGLFLVAVNCTRALATCFCASMDTGPQARAGFDLVLTELDEVFVVEVGSAAGEEVLGQLSLASASTTLVRQTEHQIEACARSQTRQLDRSHLPQALYDAHEHPRWDDVASRCLACGNCTMVCPTCFCHTVEETPDLTHQRAEHTRLWDSCFTQDHGYIHGKNIRPTIKDRYRMWLTHKLASWIDQFGTSGCVGCGRCITWCPVGIDLTEELPALLGRSTHTKGKPSQA
ncbi:4Fe-4S dicluster domain-containing protein [Nitrospira defluvii]|uniref:Sulfhydrogenase, subunit beta n=1 Tax=Nitrospira defluvii TaxID=330214 RepID=A0ABM8R8M1_9BACT|nr:4Fe-4S dicluster domain-containing protein [Nitrospira defluvii]CAE6739299.1 Sulfhydrogenase, subunit beta [Nitrospira defluvii]